MEHNAICKMSKTAPSAIQLTDPNDIAFANIAQGAKVDGATLPSGLKIPAGYNWIISGTFVHVRSNPYI